MYYLLHPWKMARSLTALSATPPVRLISTMGITLRIRDGDLLLPATPSFAAEVEKLQNISGGCVAVRIQKIK